MRLSTQQRADHIQNENSDTKPKQGQATSYPRWDRVAPKYIGNNKTDFINTDLKKNINPIYDVTE